MAKRGGARGDTTDVTEWRICVACWINNACTRTWASKHERIHKHICTIYCFSTTTTIRKRASNVMLCISPWLWSYHGTITATPQQHTQIADAVTLHQSARVTTTCTTTRGYYGNPYPASETTTTGSSPSVLWKCCDNCTQNMKTWTSVAFPRAWLEKSLMMTR
jgi:hypothetical protein